MGKQSFKYFKLIYNNKRYAWICDQREDERQRGVTIDVGLH